MATAGPGEIAEVSNSGERVARIMSMERPSSASLDSSGPPTGLPPPASRSAPIEFARPRDPRATRFPSLSHSGLETERVPQVSSTPRPAQGQVSDQLPTQPFLLPVSAQTIPLPSAGGARPSLMDPELQQIRDRALQQIRDERSLWDAQQSDATPTSRPVFEANPEYAWNYHEDRRQLHRGRGEPEGEVDAWRLPTLAVGRALAGGRSIRNLSPTEVTVNTQLAESIERNELLKRKISLDARTKAVADRDIHGTWATIKALQEQVNRQSELLANFRTTEANGPRSPSLLRPSLLQRPPSDREIDRALLLSEREDLERESTRLLAEVNAEAFRRAQSTRQSSEPQARSAETLLRAQAGLMPSEPPSVDSILSGTRRPRWTEERPSSLAATRLTPPERSSFNSNDGVNTGSYPVLPDPRIIRSSSPGLHSRGPPTLHVPPAAPSLYSTPLVYDTAVGLWVPDLPEPRDIRSASPRVHSRGPSTVPVSPAAPSLYSAPPGLQSRGPPTLYGSVGAHSDWRDEPSLTSVSRPLSREHSSSSPLFLPFSARGDGRSEGLLSRIVPLDAEGHPGSAGTSLAQTASNWDYRPPRGVDSAVPYPSMREERLSTPVPRHVVSEPRSAPPSLQSLSSRIDGRPDELLSQTIQHNADLRTLLAAAHSAQAASDLDLRSLRASQVLADQERQDGRVALDALRDQVRRQAGGPELGLGQVNVRDP